MTRSSIVRSGTTLATLATLTLLQAACSSADVEAVGSVDSAARIKGDMKDCFPSCNQADWKKLVGQDEKGVVAACAALLKELKATPNGWDPKKEICIGFDGDIKGKTACNVFRLPQRDDCKNEEMLLCSRRGEPGFGRLRPVPPKGPVAGGGALPGFPPPRPGQPPGVTDQETACIAQWKCPNTLTTFTSAAVHINAAAMVSTAALCVDGAEDACATCRDWVVPYELPADAILPDSPLDAPAPGEPATPPAF